MSDTPDAQTNLTSITSEAEQRHGAMIENETSQTTQQATSGEKLEPVPTAESDAKRIIANNDEERVSTGIVQTRDDTSQEKQEVSTFHDHAPDLEVFQNSEEKTNQATSHSDNLESGTPVVATSEQPTINAEEILQSRAPESSEVDHGALQAAINFDEAPTQEGPTTLEIDSDETDSAIGDMTPISSTASLRSSIYDAVQENGRTYHRYKEGKYLLPNDETEQERLDLQHHLCLLSLDGKLHIAPTGTELGHVLDIGTGTGIWAIEFALQNPTTTVIGSDLSPIQPSFVPLNCRFEVDDAEDVWAYSHQFDFVHGRMLFSCFKDPAGVIASAFKALENGRYLEMMDVNFPLRSIDDSLKGTALGKWSTLLIEGAKALGKDWTCTSKYPQYFRDAGFVDIQIVKYQWPTNPWAKSEQQKILGRWLQQNLLDGVSAMSMAALTRGLKMSASEVELFLVDVRNDIQDRHIHAYCPIDVVYGRKPE